MIVKTIHFDENQLPQTIIVEMTVEEAAAIASIFGKFNGHATRKLKIPYDPSIYDALSFMFNAYWDNGVEEVLIIPKDLTELNNP